MIASEKLEGLGIYWLFHKPKNVENLEGDINFVVCQ